MMTFSEYVRLREGLWLNDKNALPGMSRLTALPKRKKSKQSVVVKPMQPTLGVPHKPARAVGQYGREL
jgi:hypothetical protein